MEKSNVLDSNDKNVQNSIIYDGVTINVVTDNPDSKGNTNDSKNNYWLLYDGVNLFIYLGIFDNISKSKIYKKLKATSGTAGFQNSKYVDLKSTKPEEPGGPVPMGKYKVSLSKNPRDITKANNQNVIEQLNSGVEQLHKYRNKNQVAWWPNWGRFRARLEPIQIINPSKRSNFYIHDSYKGESHGCIETETYVYYLFIHLHDFLQSNIYLRVRYPNNDSNTNGGTANIPMIVPKNIDSTNMDIDTYYLEIPQKPYTIEL